MTILRLTIVATITAVAIILKAAAHEPERSFTEPDPRSVGPIEHTPSVAVTYADQVAAIMAVHCNECHSSGASTRKDNNLPSGGLDTTTLDGLIRGGRSGLALMPGVSNNATLLIYARDGHKRDVFGAQRLVPQDLAVLRAWIEGGAPKGDKVWPVDRFAFANVALPTVSGTRQLYLRYRLSDEAAISYSITDNKGRVIAERRGAVSSAEGSLSLPGVIEDLPIISAKDWPVSGDVVVNVSFARRPLPGSLIILTTSSAGNNDGYWGFSDLRLPEEWSIEGASAYASVWVGCTGTLEADLRDSRQRGDKAIGHLGSGTVMPGLHQIEMALTPSDLDRMVDGYPYMQFRIAGGENCASSVVVMAPGPKGNSWMGGNEVRLPP
jgi:hypothetical protein